MFVYTREKIYIYAVIEAYRSIYIPRRNKQIGHWYRAAITSLPSHLLNSPGYSTLQRRTNTAWSYCY